MKQPPSPFDKIVKAVLLNPHDHDFHYQRKDGTIYVEEIRKDKENYYYEPEVQLDLDYE